MHKEEVKIERCVLKIRNDILFTEFLPKTHLTIEDAKEIVKARIRYSDGATYNVIVDLTNVVKVEFAVRKYLASHDGYEGIEKLAIIAKSRLSRMMANFFLKLDRPVKPTMAFTSIEKAQMWLKGFSLN